MPKRTRYRNGDPVALECFGCDGCEILSINGVLCHEHGCPHAWRDYRVECCECGDDFFRRERTERMCPDCIEQIMNPDLHDEV